MSRPLEGVPTRQLRAWLKRAREEGCEVTRLGRYFTIANLSAELALRPDRNAHPGKRDRRQIRQAKARPR